MKDYQDDSKAVLLYAIEDYENGTIASVGDQVFVIDSNIDPDMPSGHSYLIKFKNSGKLYHVDKSYIIPYRYWLKVYDKALELAFLELKTANRLRGVSR